MLQNADLSNYYTYSESLRCIYWSLSCKGSKREQQNSSFTLFALKKDGSLYTREFYGTIRLRMQMLTLLGSLFCEKNTERARERTT